MEKSKVIVIKQNTYNEDEIYRKVRMAAESLGGMGNFIHSDDKVLVKPNFLYPSKPEKAVTTHPAVIKAVLRLVSETQAKEVVYGDSPANGNCKGAAYELGLKDEEYGAKLAAMDEERDAEFDFEGNGPKRKFHLSREAYEATAIINVPKMKTHMLERVTGAVKNLYGLIQGFNKAKGHVSYPNARSFAEMMAALNTMKKPRLNIMDGIVAMEGNGPSSGTPREMGVLLVSTDPVALDTVFCYLINLNPLLVPTNTSGNKVGLGNCLEENIDIELLDDDKICPISRTELVEMLGQKDFDCMRAKEKLNVLTLWSRITGGFSDKPVIDDSKCIKCGVCVAHCPVEGKAVTFKNGRDNPPKYDYKKCIRCFCCQEICPRHAISVKHSGKK